MLASFPLKFFEYLMRGRPVVARPIPALQPFREWYDQAVTASEFVAAVEQHFASDSPRDRDRRRTFAQGFGWRDRMRDLLSLRECVLDGVTPPTPDLSTSVGGDR